MFLVTYLGGPTTLEERSGRKGYTNKGSQRTTIDPTLRRLEEDE